jgi:hypothetical protein
LDILRGADRIYIGGSGSDTRLAIVRLLVYIGEPHPPIHWNEAEAEDRVHGLRKAGFSPLILTSVPSGPANLRRLLEKPIDAIVIDLSRLPSLGRDVGLGLRSRKTTRHFPIVFVDGEPDKVSRVKSVLPVG